MKAWTLNAQTGTADLDLVDIDLPEIADNEVLVRVTAPGVVPFDHAVINDENEANFPAAVLPIQPGNQGAGTVANPGTTSFKKGERVMFGAFVYGFMRPGSWAEYVAVDVAHLTRIPDSVSDGEAAQAVVAYPTAYMALKEAGMVPGKTVLATGIGGSVGNAAYQLAKAMGASKVFSCTSSSAKAERAAELGFANVIDMSKQTLAEGVQAGTGGEGVDIVIDSVGGQVIAEAVKCMKRYGKTITLGFAAGRQSQITLADLILVRGSIQGFGVYTSSPEEWQEAWDAFRKFCDAGKIKVLFDKSYPFDRAPEALRYMATQRPFGAVSLAL